MNDFDYALTLAKTYFKETGQHLPTFIGYTDDRVAHVMITPYETDQEKAVVLAAMKMYFHANKITSYVHSTEAWIKKVEQGAPIPHGPVRKMQGKEEALIVMQVTPKHKRVAYVKIEREGDTVRLGEELGSFDTVEGPFTELLPGPNYIPTEAERTCYDIMLELLDIKKEQLPVYH